MNKQNLPRNADRLAARI